MRTEIFIVDDEHDICDFLSQYLAKPSDLISSILKDDDERIKTLTSQVPPLISCDLSKPGTGAIEELQVSRQKGYETSIIMLSPLSEKEKISDILTRGSIEHVTRLVDDQELVHSLLTWMNEGDRVQSLITFSSDQSNLPMKSMGLMQVKINNR